MLHTRNHRSSATLLLAAVLLTACAALNAQMFSQVLSFQGRLCDVGGNPVADGVHAVRFTIYDAETEGNALWQETQEVLQVGGTFSLRLGSVEPFPPGLFEGGDRWLGIKVGDDPEMDQRFGFSPSPWAFYALSSGGTDDGDWTVSGNDMYSAVTGNVGIGTPTPSSKLDVVTDDEISAGRFLSPYSTVLYAEHTDDKLEDAVAVQALSRPAEGYGVGGEFQGGRLGVYGSAAPGDSDRGGEYIGVHGLADASWNRSIGVKGEAVSGPGEDSIGYGVFGTASGGGRNYAGYFAGAVQATGPVGIGQTRPQATMLLVDAPGSHAGTFYSEDLSYVIHAEYNGFPEAADSVAVEGISVPWDGFGYGGAFEGGHVGVWGRVSPTGSMPEYIGVQGDVEGGSGVNYGLRGCASASSQGANTTAYGVYAFASGPGTSYSVYGAADADSTEYSGYFEGRVFAGGNVGVGTTMQPADLDVSGTIETDAFRLTRSPTDGYVLTSDGSGNGSWQAAPGVTGSGTAGYVPLFTAPTTLGDSVVYQSGSDVAIGHTSPQSKLDVDGTVQATGFKMPVGHQSGYVLTSDGSGVGTWQEAPGGMGGGGTAGQIAKFKEAHVLEDAAIYESPAADVGIGTTAPDAKLDIDAGDTVAVNIGSLGYGAMVRYQRDGGLYQFYTGIPNKTNSRWEIQNNSGAPLVSIWYDGDVGIGTTDPAYKLDVAGDIRASGTIYGTATNADKVDGYHAGNASGQVALSNGTRCVDLNADMVDGMHLANLDTRFINASGPDEMSGSPAAGVPVLEVTNNGVSSGHGIMAYSGRGSSSWALYGRGRGSGGGVCAVGEGWHGVYAECQSSASDHCAVYARNTGSGYAGYFDGKVRVTGYLYKDGGGFQIEHPLDPANKYLYHSFVESPDMKNVYDGVAVLDERGEAWVELPEWFEALNRDFRYQLTPIAAPGPNLYIAEETAGNRFSIAGGAPGMKVSWQVTGIRHDNYAEAHRIPVEEEKPPHERGRYLHADLYDDPKR